MAKIIITAEDIENSIEDIMDVTLLYIDWCAINHAKATKTPVTQQRRWAAIGRNVFARLLIQKYGLKTISQLTKAIRAGHKEEPDWLAINTRAANILKTHLTEGVN